MTDEYHIAAFLMVYKRPDEAINHLKGLAAQSCVPEYLLIVDNGSNKCLEQEAKRYLPKCAVFYYCVGSNSGPAGAAAIALREIASNTDYKIAYWGDEDDPPHEVTALEELSRAMMKENCAVIGAVGAKFESAKGVCRRLKDQEIMGGGLIAVDYIGGGQSRLVNLDFIRKENIFPDPDLFFSFEDLEYDLRIKRRGGTIVVYSPFHLARRKQFGRIGALTEGGNGKKISTWRLYYSTRNTLFIVRQSSNGFSVCYSMIRQLLAALRNSIRCNDFGIAYAALLGTVDYCRNKRGVSESDFISRQHG